MASFKVICVATGEECQHPDGTLVTFPDGDTANAWAKAKTLENGVKYQPRRMTESLDKEWRKREAKRFYDGTYYPVPWESQDWFYESSVWKEHFLHVSVKEDAMVAFTPDEKHGQTDRQVRIKPGVYLERYFGEMLTGEEIREFVSEFSIRYEGLTFKLAKTPEEIKLVYVFGPNSCMSHSLASGKFVRTGFHRHPVEAYGAGDLAIAYIPGKDEYGTDLPGTSAARTLVWPDKKQYSQKIYGDASRLRMMLETDGYRPGTFEGARLLRIPVKGVQLPTGQVADGVKAHAFLVPYMDSIAMAIDDGKHLVLDSVNGYIGVQSASGLAYDGRRRCHACNKLSTNLNELLDKTGRFHEHVCEECVPEDQIVAESYHGYRTRAAHCAYLYSDDFGGQRVHFAFIENAIRVCSKEHIWLHRDEAMTLADGQTVSRRWVEANKAKRCRDCGKYYDDATNCEQATWCPRSEKQRTLTADTAMKAAAEKARFKEAEKAARLAARRAATRSRREAEAEA